MHGHAARHSRAPSVLAILVLASISACASLSGLSGDENVAAPVDDAAVEVDSGATGGKPDASSADARLEAATTDSTLDSTTDSTTPTDADTPDVVVTVDVVIPTPTTCAEVLARDSSAASGKYTIDPDGAGPQPELSVYCDMTTDDGGWTLLITLAPTTVTNSFTTPNDWPDEIDQTGNPPTNTGLYKGTLAPFHDVREEIASATVVAYGRGKTEAELNTIRNLYGTSSRLAAAPKFGGIPACRLAYATATDDLPTCSQNNPLTNNDSSTLGWTRDPAPTHGAGCWFARGNCCSGAGGSSQCNGDVNGTKWARTWFR